MADNRSSEVRRKTMRNVRKENTLPERLVKSFLQVRGYRFINNHKKLPGTPDIVLPKYRAAIFVHGCFWHGHDNCRYASIPATNTEFWKAKIDHNRERDNLVEDKLITLGWKVITVWQCQLKTKLKEGMLNALLYEIEN